MTEPYNAFFLGDEDYYPRFLLFYFSLSCIIKYIIRRLQIMSEKPNENKRKVPVLTFEEFLKKEKGEIVIKGPFKIRQEDTKKFMKYIEKR